MRKINLLTVFLLSFFIFNCETDNINPTDPNSKFKKVKISSLSQEPYLAGLLDKAGFKNISNGRTNGEGTNIDTNSILMVLQADSLSYSYTFKVHDKTTYNSFTNLVFKKVIDGFNAFYLKYESNDTLLDNIKGFTGKVTSYNLSWEVITTQYFDNGQIVDNPISNGRTQNCNPAVSVNTVCTQEVFDGWEQTNGAPIYKCLERVTTITLDYAHCFVGGSGGDPNYSYNWSNGTFVPFHYWDGGGGSGSASGNYNSTGITTCTSGDGGTSLESGDDPNGCGDGIGIYLPPNAEILELVLEENSFALLDIPCDQLPKWQALAQSEAPQTVKDKINQLDNNTNWFQDWAIQTLNGANGTVANMDNFGVTVSTLPNNPITGTAFTPEGFLDYFRRNINDFVEGSTFSPYCQTPSLCTQETALWNSSNPTGAIIYIDIPVDDGVVVCSKSTSTYWNFMTLEAPGAGNHPVSGTREFGFKPNVGGGYTFYIQGVDRFDSNVMENSSYMVFGGEPFAGADDLWESFQSKLKTFVNTHGGNASINTPIIYRPDWSKVKDVLDGIRPITDLGCN